MRSYKERKKLIERDGLHTLYRGRVVAKPLKIHKKATKKEGR